ncbi:MAG: putative toxin-antitoxin system toxin component, PIN family [Burkholderiales bacterium]|nr:putative toxin-antitoxin system toxin component, PIN family [Burkholderiales bacterium]
MPALRAVLDTHVLLSGIAFPSSVPGKIIAAWRAGSIDLVASEFIFEKLRRVLPRLQARHGMSAIEMDDFVDLLRLTVESVPVNSFDEPRLTEVDDLPILATLVAAQADYVITGDKALLALAQHYLAVTPAEFWARHGTL